ncbi:hypothetical protein V6N11_068142 [Hibiscus sabdariffa]|uniref:Reverse transcriptase n=1 Tax=Hibiscus sabdariffa TaxID=183260 RepID=A0ABR2SSV2_9ROSI
MLWIDVMACRHVNKVLALQLDDGSWYTDQGLLANMALAFYRNLFTSESGSLCDYPAVACFPNTDASALRSFSSWVTDDEIWRACFEMDPWNAPGPDGLHAAFYQQNWMVVDPSVCAFVRQVFDFSEFSPLINRNLLVLLPKVSEPTHLRQILPISLCNVLYKLITKTIVNRLKPWLPDWVSENQTSFVP